MTANQSPDKPQVFRSPTAVVVWVLWLLFAVGNWIDLAVQGRDRASAVAAAILLLATGAAYVTAQRPRIIADKIALTVRNPLRDHRIGWTGVAEVELADLLRVHCRWAGPVDAAPGQPGGKEHHKVISAWAVYYPRRRQFVAEARARRAGRSPGPRRSSLDLPSGARGLPYGAAVSGPETSTAGAEAERIVRVLSERATAAKAEAVWASGTAKAAGSEAAGKTRAAGTVAETRAAGTVAETRAAGTVAETRAAGTVAETGTAGTVAETGTGAAETATAAGTGTEAVSGTAAGRTTALDAIGWPDWSEPLKSTWSGRAVAALVIPALILLVVWLL